jgi:prephenate dehydratase
MQVAFQGEHGAYSEQAILDYFRDAETIPCESFDLVFDAVHAKQCDAGLIPVENSIAGSIHQNYDLLFQHPLHITGEYVLRVRHCLIALPDVKMGEIKKAISHPQALGQCVDYLRKHGIKAEQAYDTAGSVKLLKESGAQDTAAIASRRAAELYGMQILEEGIEDNTENFTRFLAIQREAVIPQGDAKTSIVFTLKDREFAKAMSIFAQHEIEITKIESRPLRGKPWEYLFYIDFIGSADEEISKRALDHLNEYALSLRALGSYARFLR